MERGIEVRLLVLACLLGEHLLLLVPFMAPVRDKQLILQLREGSSDFFGQRMVLRRQMLPKFRVCAAVGAAQRE